MDIHKANMVIAEYFDLVNASSKDDITLEESIKIIEQLETMPPLINEAMSVIGEFIHKHDPNRLRKPKPMHNGDVTQYRGHLIEIHVRKSLDSPDFYASMNEYFSEEDAVKINAAGIESIRYNGKMYCVGDHFYSNSGNEEGGRIDKFRMDSSYHKSVAQIKERCNIKSTVKFPIVCYGSGASAPICNSTKR